MTLPESHKLIWSDRFDSSLIYDSFGYKSSLDEFANPRGGLGVEFIVVIHRSKLFPSRDSAGFVLVIFAGAVEFHFLRERALEIVVAVLATQRNAAD